MNILINFRYISMIDLSESSAYEVAEAEEMNLLTKDFKRIALEYKNLHINGKDFLLNNKIHTDAKEIVKNATLKWVDQFNNNNKYYCYLWLDEICSICIDGIKAIPLEDAEDYVNFDDLKHTVQKCMYEISLKDPTIKPKNYSDVFFVVYLDIIEKGLPSFSIKSDWYK